jgi:hypothetical protein
LSLVQSCSFSFARRLERADVDALAAPLADLVGEVHLAATVLPAEVAAAMATLLSPSNVSSRRLCTGLNSSNSHLA